MRKSETARNDDFPLALAILMASGTAALGHEVLWTRRMMDLLGASPESSARVFECFFLGLSLGAATISLILPRIRKPWMFMAYVECGIALLCLPVLLLPQWSGWIWPALGPERLTSWQGSLVKSLLSVGVMLPPTFLMGMTLPVMVSAVVGSRRGSSQRQVWLYAGNTLGGVVGLLLVVLALLRIAGANGSMLVMMAVNLGVAVASYWRARRPETSDEGMAPGDAAGPNGCRVAEKPALLPLLLAFFSGAGILALEVLGLALTNLCAPLSIYPQAAILACVILLLATAAFIVGKLGAWLGDLRGMLPVCLTVAGLAIAVSPLLFLHLAGGQSGLFGYGGSFGSFLARLGSGVLTALGPGVLMAGIIFPLLVVGQGKNNGLSGQQFALLLAVNGLGGIAGAEVAYRLLVPAYAVHVSIGIVGVAYVIAGLGVVLASRAGRPVRFLVPMLGLLGVCFVTSTQLTQLKVYFGSDVFKLVSLASGREGSLAVAQDGRGNRDMIFDNEYTLGGTASTSSMRREAHLPLLMHPGPKRVGFIGFGTGITSSGALEHRAVESITAVELSPLVAAAGARDFDRFNHGIYRSPRAKVCVEDARIYLESARGRFDVIIGDLFTPWRPGEAALSSLEEFRAARGALRDGGIFCQWIELTQWTPEQLEVAATTFQKVFGRLYLLRTSFKTDRVPLGLLGFKDGGPDWGVIASRCEFEANRGGLVDPLCRHPEGVAMLYLGEYTQPAHTAARISTLGNLRLELSASEQLLKHADEAYFRGTGELLASLVRRQLESMDAKKELPAALAEYPKLGALACSFEAASGENHSAAAAMAERIMAGLPQCIASDPKADWSLWPGNQLPRESLGGGRSEGRTPYSETPTAKHPPSP